MTNEEFQKLVLAKLGSLEEGQRSLEEGQSEIKKDINEIKKDINEIKHEQKFMWDDIKRIDSRLERQEIKLKKVAP